MIVDLTEKYIKNSEEKEFKKHMIFTGRLAKFLLDELRKEREHSQQLTEENKILQNEISVSRLLPTNEVFKSPKNPFHYFIFSEIEKSNRKTWQPMAVRREFIFIMKLVVQITIIDNEMFLRIRSLSQWKKLHRGCHFCSYHLWLSASLCIINVHHRKLWCISKLNTFYLNIQ